jgi:serine/threonine protein kinase
LPFESLQLKDLSKTGCEILRPPSSTRPAIWGVQEGGLRAVVKDFSRNRTLYRNTVGRFLIRRERKAYERLRGVEGVPAYYRIIDGLALVTERIPGTNAEDYGRDRILSREFFTELEALVSKVHRRGIAHCDLKRTPNILIGDGGRPYLVDWGASISRSEFRFGLLARIYRRFEADDTMAVIKLKLKHRPAEVTPDERDRYLRRSPPEKMIRAIRDRLRRLLKKVS